MRRRPAHLRWRRPLALLFGLTAVLALIPFIGAYMSFFIGFTMIVMADPSKAIIFAVWFILAQQVEGNVIYPRVVGGSIGIGGMWVLLAVTVGGNLMGITGMVLGIPTFAVIYALVREFCDKRIAAKEAAENTAAAGAEPVPPADPAEEE